MRTGWVIVPALVALGGCGGSSSDGTAASASSAVTVVNSPQATPTATPTAAATATPVTTPSPAASTTPATTATGFAAQVAALFDVAPDPATCRAGTLKAAVKADALAKVNAMRALHGLAAVTYSDVEDAAEAESSLMMAVNRTLSHTPPADWTCYSAAGSTAAGTSNLIGGWGNGLPYYTEDDYLATWLNEGGSASIGHRRWLLSPFLGKISYGRVAYQSANGDRVSTASMKVFNFASAPAVPGGIPGFVAYPYRDYPQRYFRPGDYLSFSAVPYSGGSFGANAKVSFAAATITVTGPSGALPVTDVTFDNSGYGVANNVQWRVTGLVAGVSYTVRISGVSGTPQSEYSYPFRIS